MKNEPSVARTLVVLTAGGCVIGATAYLAVGISLTTLIGGKTAYLAYGRMAIDLWFAGSAVVASDRAINGPYGSEK